MVTRKGAPVGRLRGHSCCSAPPSACTVPVACGVENPAKGPTFRSASIGAVARAWRQIRQMTPPSELIGAPKGVTDCRRSLGEPPLRASAGTRPCALVPLRSLPPLASHSPIAKSQCFAMVARTFPVSLPLVGQGPRPIPPPPSPTVEPRATTSSPSDAFNRRDRQLAKMQ
jgi:hypothetical protein